jgi:hypothetical protein
MIAADPVHKELAEVRRIKPERSRFIGADWRKMLSHYPVKDQLQILLRERRTGREANDVLLSQPLEIGERRLVFSRRILHAFREHRKCLMERCP